MAYNEYLEQIKKNKTSCKFFLSSKTMLVGVVKDFDDFCVIVDKCMVTREQLVSIMPE